jgi:hypothetical protein
MARKTDMHGRVGIDEWICAEVEDKAVDGMEVSRCRERPGPRCRSGRIKSALLR